VDPRPRARCAAGGTERLLLPGLPGPAISSSPPSSRRLGLLRAEVLTAATELLDESGDEGAVTLRAVARRVGVSAPAPCTRFDDRQEILLAVGRRSTPDRLTTG